MKSLGIIGLVLVAIQCTAQEPIAEHTPIETLLATYRDLTLDDRYAPLKDISDPKVSDLSAVAERALAKAGEAINLKKTLDIKLVDLLTSDAGRWVATNDNAVKLFVMFDFDSIEFSDAAVGDRIQRIKKTRQILESVRGPLKIGDNRAAKMLVLDALWIENLHHKLDTRLNLVVDFNNRFPKSQKQDWKKLRTLRDAKAAKRSQLEGLVLGAAFEGFETARIEGVELRRKQAYDAEMKKTIAEVQGKEELAEQTRKFIQAEYQVKVAAKQSEIVAQERKREQIERHSREATQLAEAKKLRAYLQTPRVVDLLAPFCGPGMTLPRCHRNKHPIPDPNQLEPGPMSYARIHKEVLASRLGQARQLDYLTAVANDPGNDRPASWGIADSAWRQAGNTFKDMNGKHVNKYVEAYKILRDHGSILVELGMLRP